MSCGNEPSRTLMLPNEQQQHKYYGNNNNNHIGHNSVGHLTSNNINHAHHRHHHHHHKDNDGGGGGGSHSSSEQGSPTPTTTAAALRQARRKRRWQFCLRYSAYVFSHIGLTVLVFGYTLLGAFLFKHFEEPYHRTQKNWLETIRNETVDKLWMETYKLNVLYKENWTAIANKEIEHFERSLTKAINEGYRHQEAHQADARWSLADSWLFSFSVITTIGYANKPSTHEGKLATIAYALVGIPLMLLFLSTIGALLGRCLKHLYQFCCVCSSNDLPPHSVLSSSAATALLQQAHQQHQHQQASLSDYVHQQHQRHLASGIVPQPQMEQPQCHTQQPTIRYTHDNYQVDAHHEHHHHHEHLGSLVPTPMPNLLGYHSAAFQFDSAAAAAELGTTPTTAETKLCNIDLTPMNHIYHDNKPAAYVGHLHTITTSTAAPYPCPGLEPLTGASASSPLPAAPLSCLEPTMLHQQHCHGPLEAAAAAPYEAGGCDNIPFYFCFLLVLIYILWGAFIIHLWEGWSISEGVYYCFLTLSTIGFGDIVPERTFTLSPTESKKRILLIVLYILLGMSLIAMSFNIIYEQLAYKFKHFGHKFRPPKLERRDEAAVAAAAAAVAAVIANNRGQDLKIVSTDFGNTNNENIEV